MRKRILVALTSSILVSCGANTTRIEGERPSKTKGTPVRYLQEITCDEKNYNCYKEGVTKRIEELCIENGFVRERPAIGVIYSRDISERIRGTARLVSKRLQSQQTTDPNGVVTSEDVLTEQITDEEVSGYCIGSEYIVAEYLE